LVYYDQSDIAEEVIQSLAARKTQLTEWFTANQTYPNACNYTYQDFPEGFVFNHTQRKWTPRQQRSAIGRMTFVYPSAGERFYLRLLLTIVKGEKNILRSFILSLIIFFN
jgi:hypothetical protein